MIDDILTAATEPRDDERYTYAQIATGEYFYKADIWRQTFERPLLDNALVCFFTRGELQDYGQIECPDCAGTGTFEEPEQSVECVACKGTGALWVNLL